MNRTRVRFATYGLLSFSVGGVIPTSAQAMQAPSVTRDIAIASRGEKASKVSEVILSRPVTVTLRHATMPQAIDAIAKNAKVPVYYQVDIVERYTQPVTLTVKAMALGEVFDRIFSGTALHLTPLPNARLAVTANAAIAMAGGITGQVTDARTKRPLQGVTVSLDGAARGAQTGEDGQFHLGGISVGSHKVVARRIGYVRQLQTIVVAEGSESVVSFALVPSTNTLDQVVVTGTVVETERRAIPNAITVVTAKQLEERGITRIDQLFRGDVPGLFAVNQGTFGMLDEVTMYSRGATTLNYVNVPIKTYVDGIEMADPKYLSQIDPKSIERIEILTGPQASTIYGSNAINGVMQIFTKRGTTERPQLTLNLLSGWVENDFSDARTPRHDFGAQVSGVEGRFSYNAGGSWNYTGPWTPGKQTTVTSGFGGGRFEMPSAAGRVTADVTLRRTVTQTQERGSVLQPITEYVATGWYSGGYSPGISAPTTHSLHGDAVGVSLGYAPTSWWSHDLQVGQDAEDRDKLVTGSGYAYQGDTVLRVEQERQLRRSQRYTTTVRVPLTGLANATVTAGADAWQSLSNFMAAETQSSTGSLINSYVSRQPGHNTGGFVQTQLALADRLFLQYGVRAEWNPNLGQEAEPNLAPKYGIAYSQDVGSVTAKLRFSYGRSTRPPWRDAKDGGSPQTVDYMLDAYGPYDILLANPLLVPEMQKGSEGGLELYLGQRASIIVTRYNQTVDDLIVRVSGADSVRSLAPNPLFFGMDCAALRVRFGESNGICSSQDADGYIYVRQEKNLNIGAIRNQGWELQGSVTTGPLVTRGSYSWTKSRVIGITPQFRSLALAAAYAGDYQPGATFVSLPEHTWAGNVTYANARATVGLSVTGTGQMRIGNNDFFFRSIFGNIRLQQNRLNVRQWPFGQRPPFPFEVVDPSVLADLNASYRFGRNVEGVLNVQNLTDFYINEVEGANPTMGRQVRVGARCRL
jgi:outer membrane receptor protein involved in Fe transport